MTKIVLDQWAVLDPALMIAEINRVLESGTFTPLTVTLSSAQIRTSFSSPILAIPGVPGKTIVIDRAIFDYARGEADYEGEDVGIGFGYRDHVTSDLGGINPLLAGITFATLLNGSGQYRVETSAGANAGVSVASLRGVDVVIASFPSDPTTGDGTLTVTATYSLV